MFTSMSMRGATEFAFRLEASPRLARVSTVQATRKAQTLVKREVKNSLKGGPRWSYRGKSKVYAEPFRVEPGRARKIGARSGPPGKFSGDLIRGVGGKKRISSLGGIVSGGVGVGKTVNNLKKRSLEERFPFFAPAVNRVEPVIPAIYAEAWGRAIGKVEG